LGKAAEVAQAGRSTYASAARIPALSSQRLKQQQRQGESPPLLGLVQNWGSGGSSGWRERVVGWMEFLSEFGTERIIIDRASNLKQ
jgi:hypothetical protein